MDVYVSVHIYACVWDLMFFCVMGLCVHLCRETEMCRCVCVWCVCVCVCVYSSRAIDRMDAYVSIHMITHTRTNTHAHTHTHTHTHTHSHTLTHTHTHTHTHGVDKHLQRVFPPPPPLSLSHSPSPVWLFEHLFAMFELVLFTFD